MSQPNVLLICADHFPGPLMGAMGHSRILTPPLTAVCPASAAGAEKVNGNFDKNQCFAYISGRSGGNCASGVL